MLMMDAPLRYIYLHDVCIYMANTRVHQLDFSVFVYQVYACFSLFDLLDIYPCTKEIKIMIGGEVISCKSERCSIY